MKAGFIKFLEFQKAEMESYLNNLQKLFSDCDLFVADDPKNILFALNYAQLIKSDFEIDNDRFSDSKLQSLANEFSVIPNNIIKNFENAIFDCRMGKDVSTAYKNNYHLTKFAIDKMNRHLIMFYGDCKNPYHNNQHLIKKYDNFKDSIKSVVYQGKNYINIAKASRNYFKKTNEKVEKAKELW